MVKLQNGPIKQNLESVMYVCIIVNKNVPILMPLLYITIQ